MNKVQKYTVLFALFIVPLLFYILLSTGINNFARLPILTSNITDVSTINKDVTFKRKISIVTFIGSDIDKNKGELFNLNQKIYKQFYGFKDFQFVVLVPKGTEKDIEDFKKNVGAFTNMEKWNFVFGTENEVNTIYNGLKTNEKLDANLHSYKAFIIDKEFNLRGRNDDDDSKNGLLYGYDMRSVGELNDKMKDDVKVVLAEYRLALKKNNADRQI